MAATCSQGRIAGNGLFARFMLSIHSSIDMFCGSANTVASFFVRSSWDSVSVDFGGFLGRLSGSTQYDLPVTTPLASTQPGGGVEPGVTGIRLDSSMASPFGAERA